MTNSSEAWGRALAPNLDALRILAEAALGGLPEIFRARFGSLAILIEEFPDDETLDAMGIDSPFDLLGLYRGVDLTRASGGDVLGVPNMVHLYRRPILDAWAEGESTLGELVTHVLVHEIGHHFGLSDDAMDLIERSALDSSD